MISPQSIGFGMSAGAGRHAGHEVSITRVRNQLAAAAL
jgi:hypothetical protein